MSACSGLDVTMLMILSLSFPTLPFNNKQVYFTKKTVTAFLRGKKNTKHFLRAADDRRC